MDELSPKLINKRYKLIRCIADSDLLEVYLSQDILHRKRSILLKRIKNSIIERISVKKSREIFEAFMRISHPNIVRVFDFGSDHDNEQDIYYYITEMAEGDTLSELISRDRTFTLEEVFNILAILSSALDFIHSRGLVHGNIRPDNIVFDKEDIKLLDFDLTAIAKPGEFLPGYIHGYSVPESLNYEADHLSDIYQLGILTLELLTGRSLFGSSESAQILEIIKDFRMFEQNRAKIIETIGDYNLRVILLKMTAFNKHERYQSCDEIILDVNRLFLSEYPVQIDPSAGIYFHSPAFILRLKEISLIKSALESTSKTRTVLVSGPSGIGKNSLLNEIKSHCGMNGILFLEGRCNESDLSSFLPVKEIIEKIIPYMPEESFHRDGYDLEGIISGKGLLDAYIKDKDGDPEFAKEILLDLICRVILSFSDEYSSKEPVVICIRDLHFADSDTIEFIRVMSYKISKGDHSLRLIVSINSDYVMSFNMSGFLKRNNIDFTDIFLHPLKAGDIVNFMESILGRGRLDNSITEIIDYMQDKSGGNPMYLQEIIRELIILKYIVKSGNRWSLSEKFQVNIEIPRLKEMYVKRISRLGLKDSEISILRYLALCYKMPTLLELCSFIDQDIKGVESALRRLQDYELIDFLENLHDTAYRIKNSLVRESLIHIMSDEELHKYHGKIAEMLEQTYEQQNEAEEFIDAIAFHFYKAGKSKKAVHYLIIAGKLADSLFSYEKSALIYKRLLEINDADNKAVNLHINLRLASISRHLNQAKKAEEYAEKAQMLACDIGDLAKIARSQQILSQIYTVQGQHEKAKQILKYLLDYYSAEGNNSMLISIYNDYGNVYWNTGEYEKAESLFRKQIETAEEANDYISIGKAYNNMGLICFHRGQSTKAREYFEKCLDIGNREGNKILTSISLGNLGLIYWRKMDFEKALKYYNEKLEISKSLGLKREISTSLLNIADIMSDRGDYTNAVGIYQEQLEISRFINDRYLMTIASINIGTVYKETGDLQRALFHLKQAHKNAVDIDNKELVSVSLVNLGDVYKILNDLKTSGECYQEAVSVAESISLKIYLPYYYLVQADLELIRGNFAASLECTKKGFESSKEIDDSSYVYDLNIIEMMAHFYLSADKNEKERIIHDLKGIALSAGDDKETAFSCWAVFQLTSDFFWGYFALTYYRKLHERIPKLEYRIKIEQLENLLKLMHIEIRPDQYLKSRLDQYTEHSMEMTGLYKDFDDLDHYHKLKYFISEIIYLCNRHGNETLLLKEILQLSRCIEYILKLDADKDRDLSETRKDVEDAGYQYSASHSSDIPGDTNQEVSSIITGDLAHDFKNVEMLLEAIRASSSTLELNALLVRIMDMILNVTDAERGFILLRDKQDGKLQIRVKRSRITSEEEITEDFSRSIPKKVFQSGVPICLRDSAAESATTSMLNLDLRSVMCVPLQTRNDRFGVIYVDSQMAMKEFSKNDLMFFNALTSQIAGAIENARLYNEAVELTARIQKYNQQIENLKNLLNNVVNTLPSVIFALDLNGRITMWNTTAKILTGSAGIEAVGKNIWEEFPFLSKYAEYSDKVIASQSTFHLYKESIDFPDGRGVFYDVLVSPLISDKTEGVVFRIDDITENEKKNQQLIQAQKIEIVGTLASGLAHDLNNILGVLIGSISLIQMKVDSLSTIDANEITSYLDSMNTGIDRAKYLIRQLIGFTRREKGDFRKIDINLCIENILSLCKMSLDKRVSYDYKLYPGPAWVYGNMSQIEQAVLNICINASQAMTIMRNREDEKGGRISLNVRRVFADEEFCSNNIDIVPGYYWVISIGDDGVGMDKDLLSKIFEPFFTTKSEDGGTGLGLFMVYEIIKKHSGMILVNSEPGAGTRFDIYLPEADETRQ